MSITIIHNIGKKVDKTCEKNFYKYLDSTKLGAFGRLINGNYTFWLIIWKLTLTHNSRQSKKLKGFQVYKCESFSPAASATFFTQECFKKKAQLVDIE